MAAYSSGYPSLSITRRIVPTTKTDEAGTALLVLSDVRVETAADGGATIATRGEIELDATLFREIFDDRELFERMAFGADKTARRLVFEMAPRNKRRFADVSGGS